jgi:hypothetical protein
MSSGGRTTPLLGGPVVVGRIAIVEISKIGSYEFGIKIALASQKRDRYGRTARVETQGRAAPPAAS